MAFRVGRLIIKILAKHDMSPFLNSQSWAKQRGGETGPFDRETMWLSQKIYPRLEPFVNAGTPYGNPKL